jgi:hypothetical protein
LALAAIASFSRRIRSFSAAAALACFASSASLRAAASLRSVSIRSCSASSATRCFSIAVSRASRSTSACFAAAAFCCGMYTP